MKRKLLFGMIFLQMIICAGCAGLGKEPTESSLSFDKKGAVKSVIVEPFEEAYLSLDELQGMIDREVSAYNAENGVDSIRAEKAYLNENQVIEQMTFSTYKDYAEFNDRNLFVGTIEEAKAQGYQLQVALENLEEAGDYLSPDDLDKLSDFSILIVDEPGKYNLYGTPGYASNGVTLVGKKNVHVSEEMEGIAYILFR